MTPTCGPGQLLQGQAASTPIQFLALSTYDMGGPDEYVTLEHLRAIARVYVLTAVAAAPGAAGV